MMLITMMRVMKKIKMNSDRNKQKERYAIMIMKLILRNQRLKRRAESLENKRQR